MRRIQRSPVLPLVLLLLSAFVIAACGEAARGLPADSPSTSGVTESSSASSRPAGSLTAAQGSSNVGSRKTVCGNVKTPTYASSSNGKPTFLSLDKEYPNQVFTVVIWGDNRPAFPSAPEKLYRSKTICATGLIESYRGVAQIEATSPSQIRVVE